MIAARTVKPASLAAKASRRAFVTRPMAALTTYVKAKADEPTKLGDCPFCHRVLLTLETKQVAGAAAMRLHAPHSTSWASNVETPHPARALVGWNTSPPYWDLTGSAGRSGSQGGKGGVQERTTTWS